MDDSGLQREKDDQRNRAAEIFQKDDELFKLKSQEEPFMTRDKEAYYRRIGELERRLGELRSDEAQALDRWMREQQNASQRLQDLRMRDANTMDPRTRDYHYKDLQRLENRAEVYRELERTLRDAYNREYNDKDSKLTQERAKEAFFKTEKQTKARVLQYLEPRVAQLKNLKNYRPSYDTNGPPPSYGYGQQNNYPPPPPQGYQQRPQQYNQPPPPPSQGYQQQQQYNQNQRPPPQQQQVQNEQHQHDLAGCCAIL